MRKAIVSAIDKATILVLLVLFCVMVSITFAQVFARYVLSSPLFWSEELARYCFVWIVFIGAAAALKRGSHIGVDYFVKRWSKPVINKISIPVKMLIAFFLAIVIINAIPVIRSNMSQRSPAVGLQMGVVYLAIPIGAAIMLVYTVDELVDLVRALFGARTNGDG